jgi:hypothetical protein
LVTISAQCRRALNNRKWNALGKSPHGYHLLFAGVVCYGGVLFIIVF